jgi:ABC-type uncharacterized transport system substrate-binding protein
VDRRRFLLTSLAAALAGPLAAEAQQAGRVYRIGYLTQGHPSHSGERNALAGFQEGLRDLGYVEGQNLLIEYRWAEMNLDRLPALADELVQLKVDVIAAVATRASLAAKQITKTVPIVMTISLHAVESGLVTNLSHPGGNVTGMTQMSDETAGKRLALLKEALPGLSRVGVLWNPNFYNWKPEPQWRAFEIAAPRVGVTLQSVEVRAFSDFESVFAAMRRSQVNGVIVFADPLTVRHGKHIADLAVQHRLPTIAINREAVEAGGLMSYGRSFFDSSRRAAAFVDKILKGAKPGDLPVEQPTKFELLINLKTAKALGLTIPPSLLLRADQVIE